MFGFLWLHFGAKSCSPGCAGAAAAADSKPWLPAVPCLGESPAALWGGSPATLLSRRRVRLYPHYTPCWAPWSRGNYLLLPASLLTPTCNEREERRREHVTDRLTAVLLVQEGARTPQSRSQAGVLAFLGNAFSEGPLRCGPLLASQRLSNKQIPMTNVRNQNCSGIMSLKLCKSSFEIYPLPRNPLGKVVVACWSPPQHCFVCVCVIFFGSFRIQTSNLIVSLMKNINVYVNLQIWTHRKMSALIL